MKFLLQLFGAFCVATVLAQCIVLGLSAYRGNLDGDTLLQGFALLNGIDITGKRLEDAVRNGREAPMPSYDDVTKERAQKSLNLDMRERSIRLAKEQVEAKQRELQMEIANFDNRKDAFYSKLDEMSKGIEDASLKDVRRTLESLPPEQSKDQLLKLIKDGQLADVVAIVKGMPADKSKKILGEFLEPEESEKLYEILRELRKGEPTNSLLDKARDETAT
jgi:flagellar motility protein MotE (MotC chaperone)